MSSITIEKCQPNIGAEFHGVDLGQPLTSKHANAIRNALLEHQVVVFRHQNIDRQHHKALAEIFVEDEENPFTLQQNQPNPVPGYPEIMHFEATGKRRVALDIWHTDEPFREIPPSISVLRGLIIPAFGGDTVFSSAVAAYQHLPDEVKKRIRPLQAMNSVAYFFRHTYGVAAPDKAAKQMHDFPSRAQPVVRVHPLTRRPALFVNEGYSGEIVGMDQAESRELLRYLFDQIKKPDYQMRVRWKPGTIIAWDNRSVQHYAVGDYCEPRVMERITVADTHPVIGISDLDGNPQ